MLPLMFLHTNPLMLFLLEGSLYNRQLMYFLKLHAYIFVAKLRIIFDIAKYFSENSNFVV